MGGELGAEVTESKLSSLLRSMRYHRTNAGLIVTHFKIHYEVNGMGVSE